MSYQPRNITQVIAEAKEAYRQANSFEATKIATWPTIATIAAGIRFTSQFFQLLEHHRRGLVGDSVLESRLRRNMRECEKRAGILRHSCARREAIRITLSELDTKALHYNVAEYRAVRSISDYIRDAGDWVREQVPPSLPSIITEQQMARMHFQVVMDGIDATCLRYLEQANGFEKITSLKALEEAWFKLLRHESILAGMD